MAALLARIDPGLALDVQTYIALGLDHAAPEPVNGRSNADILAALNHPGDAIYHPCPEAVPESEIPAGEVTRHADWEGARIYPGTTRDLFVYIPAGLDRSRAANLIVFNDGVGYLSRRGSVRAGLVLDTLHAKQAIEPTVAVFVNPGRPVDSRPTLTPVYDAASMQRSLEYDALTPDYGRFLLEDVLPFVESTHGLSITNDPTRRTVCGMSSGGICALTVAWHYPGLFARVMSHCGSYTNIRGGHVFPYLVRATPRKPIRIFLQSGANDAATVFGDWPLANQTMAKAFEYAGYDFRFEFGTGGHTLRHGGALFADALRWLWRDAGP